MTAPSLSNEELTQKSYYNSIATEYDRHYSKDLALQYRAQLYDKFLNNPQLHGKKVLDAMCGGGQNTSYFLDRGADVTGIDISEAQCVIYKQRHPNCRIVCGSALSTGFADQEFDFIYVDSLHHLHPNVTQAMEEFKRVLKPGGKILIWEPAAGSILDLARKLWYRLDRRYFQDNEAAIDPERLIQDQQQNFKTVALKYGGNVGYVFVFLSMALRIPVALVQIYGRTALALESLISKVQGRRTSLWFLLALERK